MFQSLMFELIALPILQNCKNLTSNVQQQRRHSFLIHHDMDEPQQQMDDIIFDDDNMVMSQPALK